MFVPLAEGHITVTIGNKTMPVLIDTGASVSFINPKLIQSLHKQGYPINLTKIRDRVALADNKVYNINFKATLAIHINGKRFSQSFYVLGVLNRQIILGLNFLKKHQAQISFTSHQAQDKYLVRARKAIYIEPQTQLTVCANVMTATDITQCVGITEQHNTDGLFQTLNALVTPHINNNGFTTIPITLANQTNSPIRVMRGGILGSMVVTDEQQYTPLTLNSMQQGQGEGQDDPDNLFTPINCGQDPLDELAQPGEPLKYTLADMLSGSQKQQIQEVIESNRGAFVTTDSVMGLKTDFIVSIDLKEGAIPSSRAPYRTTPI